MDLKLPAGGPAADGRTAPGAGEIGWNMLHAGAEVAHDQALPTIKWITDIRVSAGALQFKRRDVVLMGTRVQSIGAESDWITASESWI
jgi:hypothetical protein